jgi:hypothetical protein
MPQNMRIILVWYVAADLGRFWKFCEGNFLQNVNDFVAMPKMSIALGFIVVTNETLVRGMSTFVQT